MANFQKSARVLLLRFLHGKLLLRKKNPMNLRKRVPRKATSKKRQWPTLLLEGEVVEVAAHVVGAVEEEVGVEVEEEVADREEG
jgi:hypothetical protein